MVFPDFNQFSALARQGNFVPVYQEWVADLDTPVSAWYKVCAGQPYSFLLESVEGGENIGRYSFLGCDPLWTLAAKGALERFGIDFMAVQQADGNWDLQAIEINLRKGGTTHPFMTLKLLTNGRYDLSTGLFYSQQGRAKYYVATDNLHKKRYRGLLPNDLMDIIASHRLHFDTGTETGTVFHLMGCLSEFGKLGLTSIGNSPQQAKDIYNQVVKVLDTVTS